MVIDRASIFADRFKDQPQILQAAVLGPSSVPGLDPYTALRAVQLLKESAAMNAARAAQQPTNSPSLVTQAIASPMPMGMPVGALPQAAPQQAPVMRASGGLAALPSGSHDYALGGMVSFSGDEDDEDSEGQLVSAASPGDPKQYAAAQVSLDAIMQRILANPKVQMMSPEQRRAFITRYMQDIQSSGGENPYGAMRQDIESALAESGKNLEQAQGVALLEAAAEAVKPGGTMRGLAGAAAAFGGSYGRALQADRSEKRNLANMKFQLADSERKERMGLYREARMAADAADKSAVEAARDARTRDIEAAKIEVGRLKATRTVPAKVPAKKLDIIAYENELENLMATERPKEGETPKQFEARIKAQASKTAQAQARESGYAPSRLGVEGARLDEAATKRVDDAVKAFVELPQGPYAAQYKQADRALKEAVRTKQSAETIQAREDKVKEILGKVRAEAEKGQATTAGSRQIVPGAPSAAPAAAARPAQSVLIFDRQGNPI